MCVVILGLMTLTLFQGHMCVRNLNCKFYVLICLSWNCVQFLITSSRSWIFHCFWVAHMFQGDKWCISLFEKKKNVCFFSDTIKARSFKLCLVITLLWGLHCHPRLDDLDFVSWSQVCQKYKLQIACLGSLSSVVYMLYGPYRR